jgi:hypothetical protein
LPSQVAAAQVGGFAGLLFLGSPLHRRRPDKPHAKRCPVARRELFNDCPQPDDANLGSVDLGLIDHRPDMGRPFFR